MGLTTALGFLGGGGGGGGGAPSGSTSSAKSGDASSSLNFDFSANNAFQVGGSGASNQTASADKGISSDKTLMYIGLGVAGLSVLGVVAWSLMRKA